MTAVAGHLGHDVSKTLWVVVTCVLLVILASEHTPPSGQGGWYRKRDRGGHGSDGGGMGMFKAITRREMDLAERETGQSQQGY